MKCIIALLPLIMINLTYGGLRALKWKDKLDNTNDTRSISNEGKSRKKHDRTETETSLDQSDTNVSEKDMVIGYTSKFDVLQNVQHEGEGNEAHGNKSQYLCGIGRRQSKIELIYCTDAGDTGNIGDTAAKHEGETYVKCPENEHIAGIRGIISHQTTELTAIQIACVDRVIDDSNFHPNPHTNNKLVLRLLSIAVSPLTTYDNNWYCYAHSNVSGLRKYNDLLMVIFDFEHCNENEHDCELIHPEELELVVGKDLFQRSLSNGKNGETLHQNIVKQPSDGNNSNASPVHLLKRNNVVINSSYSDRKRIAESLYVGCTRDDPSSRDLPHYIGDNTYDECFKACRTRGYPYMGRQHNNQCFCGNAYGSHGSRDDCVNCDHQNGGYGGDRNCIFRTEVKDGEIVLERGKKINTISEPPNDFFLSFKLYPWGRNNDYSSILRYTSSSNNCCDYEDRWFQVEFEKNSYQIIFTASYASDPKNNVHVDGVVVNEWNEIEVRAIGNSINFYINGVHKGHLPNGNRPQLNFVDVYAGDSFFPSAKAFISDYVFMPVEPSDIVLSRGNVIKQINNPSTNFVLSFQLYPWGKVDGFSSILRYTSTSNNYGNYGDRWITFLFKPNSYGIEFEASSNVRAIISTDGVVANTWNDVRVEAIGDLITLYINNNHKGYLPKVNRPQLDNVKIYAGDNMHDPANAIIRDHMFTPLQSGDIVPVRGNKINTIPNPSNDFVLSFQLYARGTRKEYGSLIRLTSTSDNGGSYGDRWLCMFLVENSYKIRFAAGNEINVSEHFDADGVLGNEWNEIKVIAIGDFIRLYVNGIEKAVLPNTRRPQLDAVDVYAGDNFWSPVDAIIRDYVFTPAEPSDIVPFSGNLIETITWPSNYFIMSFQLYARGTANNYNNIIRYTSSTSNSNDSGSYGDRWLCMLFLESSYQIRFFVGNERSPLEHFDTDGVVGNEWNNIKVEAIGDVIKLYINNVEKGQLSNENRKQVDSVDVYAGDNFYDPANVIIREFVFTQYDQDLGKLKVLLPDETKTLLRVKHPLNEKEYFHSSADSSKIHIEGTSKLEYYFADPVVIRKDGTDLSFDFSAKKENSFDKIALCFNDNDCFNLVGANLIEDEYGGALIADKQYSIKLKETLLSGDAEEYEINKLTIDAQGTGNKTVREIVIDGVELEFLHNYNAVIVLGTKGDFSVETDNMSDNGLYYGCGIGLKEKKLWLVMCNHNNWNDKTGDRDESSTTLCTEDRFILAIRFNAENFEIGCGLSDFSGTNKKKNMDDVNSDWHGYSNAFLSKFKINSNNKLEGTFTWAECGKEFCDHESENPKVIFEDLLIHEPFILTPMLLAKSLSLTPKYRNFYSSIHLQDMTIMLPAEYPYNDIDSVQPKFDIEMSVNDLKEEVREPFLSERKEQSYTDLFPGKKYHIDIEPLRNGQPVSSANGRLKGSAIIPCSCQNVNEDTGSPADLKITQEDGFVWFSFTDQSLCEDGFSLHRTQRDQKTVLAPSYQYFASNECGDIIKPGKDFADDLSRSNLIVGEIFAYCVSAVAPNYMAQPSTIENLHPPFKKQSDSTCESHTIQWEASVKVTVRLKYEAGSLPVEAVTIIWTLHDNDEMIEINNNEANTTSDGCVTIKLKVDGDKLQNDKLYKLKIQATKETSSDNKTIHHTFLCDNEAIECVDGSSDVYVKHLDFDKVVNFADDTSVPITGKVIVAGTVDESKSPLGCPIEGAKVCLQRKISRTFVDTDVCSATNSDGTYQLPATIGTIISLKATYLNHTIISVDGKRDELVEGIDIVPDAAHTGFDFKDLDKTYLVIDMAGGLCNKTLGTADFELKINGCDWTKVLTQDTWQKYHLVPKQLVNLKVEKITHPDPDGVELHNAKDELGEIIETKDFREDEEPRLEHHERLGTGPCTVDVNEDETEYVIKNETYTAELCETECTVGYYVGFQFNKFEKICYCIENGSKPKMIAKGEDENTVCYKHTTFDDEEKAAAAEKRKDEVFGTDHTIRFQYDGNLVIFEATIEEDKNNNGECSKNVVETGQLFKSKVMLKRELVPDQVYCDVIDEATSVHIINNIGLDVDDDYIQKLTETGMHEDVLELITKCVDGCDVNVTHDINEETNAMSGARVEELFIAGFPITNNPYNNSLTVTLPNDSSHTFDIVVTGDKNINGIESVGFPTHHPLLVIRDPPGGNSYVNFENIVTTAVIQQSSLERYKSLEANLETAVGVDQTSDICTGAVVAYFCVLSNEAKVAGGISHSTQDSFLADYDDETNSHQFTSSWSYTTSVEAEFAGKESDVVLVPNLNVEFRKVNRVSWNEEECTASMEEIQVFDLRSEENKAAFSFLTFPQINSIVIPEIEAMLQNEAEHSEKYGFLFEAKARWTGFLEDYDSKTEEIMTNENKISHWFQSDDNEHTFNSETAADQHWHGLVPEIFDQSKDSEFEGEYKMPEGAPQDVFENTDRILFSGGGSGLEFVMSDSKLREILELDEELNIEDQWLSILARALVASLSNPIGGVAEVLHDLSTTYKNQDWNHELGSHLTTEFNILGAAIEIEGSVSGGDAGSIRSFEGLNNETETSVTIFLGDPDSSDQFSLDVYIDPLYRTFIFDVRSGISSCPWEGEPLTRLEDPEIELIGSVKSNVPEDQAIFFKVKMRNNQNTMLPNLVPLEVILDPSSNPHNLRLEMFGASLQGPHQINFEGDEPIEVDLAVHRGPVEHEYPPLKISLRSQCEAVWPLLTGKHEHIKSLSNAGSNENAMLKFLTPCPQVRWAGDLLLDQAFVVNEASTGLMTVVIYNLNGNSRTLFEEKSKGRLESVKLMYRQEKGEWVDGVIDNENKVDFVKDEIEQYGYLRMSWNVNDVARAGNYEVKVESKCSTQSDLPDEYKKFSTEIIKGIIDKNPPIVYGKTSIEKSNSIISPDSEVIVDFTEELLCVKPLKFNVRIKSVSDNVNILDSSNLQLICNNNQIRFYIEPSARNGLHGIRVQMVLINVQDLAGNVMNPDPADPYTLDFEFSGNDRFLLQEEGELRKGAGCDGVDQDNDGIVDDCSEDKTPPSISIHGVPVFSHPSHPNVPFLESLPFSTVDKAKIFLQDNLLISDDCATDLNIDISTPVASCDETRFDVKVTDPRCGEINAHQTTSKSYLLRVDRHPPTVFAGFHPASRPLFYDAKKNILVVEESQKNFININFWHKVEDNCKQKVKVDVTVKSNENSYDKPMVMMRKIEYVEQESQLQVYVEPSSCKTKEENENNFCEGDSNVPIRFYEVHVKATDYGGHVSNVTATVVVIPKIESKMFDQEGLYNETYLEYVVTKESKRYVLESMIFDWDVI